MRSINTNSKSFKELLIFLLMNLNIPLKILIRYFFGISYRTGLNIVFMGTATLRYLFQHNIYAPS